MSPQRITLYIIGSIVISIPFSYFSGTHWAGAVGASIYAADIMASMFVLGPSIVLGAALLMKTTEEMELAPEMPVGRHYAREIVLVRYVILLILSSAAVVAWTIVAYVLTMQVYPFLAVTSIMIYIPGTLIAALAVSAIFAAIILFLATVVHNWRFVLAVCFIFFFAIGVVFGMTPYLSSSDSLAIFSPYHLFRFLSVALSGSIIDPEFGPIWGDPSRMNMIFGVPFGLSNVILSLGCWTLLGSVLLVLTQYPMQRSLSILALETKLTQFESGDQSVRRALDGLQTSLRASRQALAIALVIILIVLPIVHLNVINSTIAENTHLLYESSTEGESLAVGVWKYGQVEVPEPPLGLNNMYQIHVEILDWDGCPEKLDAWFIFKNITLGTFEAMNDTQKDALSGWRSLNITSSRSELGGGFISVQTTGTHVWGIKFAPSTGYTGYGIVRVIITVTVEAT